MNINCLKAADLTKAHCAAWEAMRRDNPALYSPYFHPHYTQRLGKLQDDAYVAIIQKNEDIIGFLPFQQRRRGGSARPIGAPMTDYHGIISAAPLKVDMTDILRRLSIGALHMPQQMNVPVAAPSGGAMVACAVMRLADYAGADAWRKSRDSSYRRHLKSLRRRIKKTDTEVGARAFIWQSQDPAHFDRLLKWKTQKFSDTGKYNVLGVDWTRRLLRQLWEAGPNAALRCDLHVMMVGGKPAAMDLGLTDGITFHSWMVGYDNALHNLSPGMQLLEALVTEAPKLGYENIDLGAGLEGYKKHYATWPHHAQSNIWLGRGITAQRSKFYAAIERKGQAALKDIPGKFRRRYSQIAACDPSRSGQLKAMLSAIKNGG